MSTSKEAANRIPHSIVSCCSSWKTTRNKPTQQDKPATSETVDKSALKDLQECDLKADSATVKKNTPMRILLEINF